MMSASMMKRICMSPSGIPGKLIRSNYTECNMKLSAAQFLLFLLVSCTSIRETEGVFVEGKAIHLSPPKITMDSVLFLDFATLTLELDYPGAEIFYTEDGSVPDRDSRLYSGPARIEASKTITARAFHPDLLPSEPVSREFRKMQAPVGRVKVEVHPEADTSYPGRGPQTLADRKKGSLNFRKGNDWLGFQADTIDIGLVLDDEVPVESVTLSVLEDHGAWIFLPKRIEVFVQDKLIGSREWPSAGEARPPSTYFLEVPVKKTKTKRILVKVANWAGIPDWHPGKGTAPWLFTDELLIN